MADVIAAVKFAKDNGLLVAVRDGGHSYPGLSVCGDGLVIDLSLMKGIRVDPEARTVRAQAGVLLGELDRETQTFGLAVPSGIVTRTGLSGLTLGGGINWLMRKYGLTIAGHSSGASRMRFGASTSVGLPPPAGARTLPATKRALRRTSRTSWSTALTRTATCSWS